MARVALRPACMIVSNHGAPIDTCILRLDEPQPTRRTRETLKKATKAAKGDRESDRAVHVCAVVVNKQLPDLHLAQEHAIAA